jgi:hypothetical protein
MRRKSSYVLHRIASWPKKDVEELEEAAREIEVRRTGLYRLTDDERSHVRIGLEEADIGHFMSDKTMAEADKHHDL